MAARDYFARDYAEARRKFRAAATAAGAALQSHINPRTTGPGGEELSTEVARWGPMNAGRVLITVSATHGAEGFCGSGAQAGSFAAGLARELPADTALIAIHAINPHGFAWLRRVTEDNIDLNRNYVDHSRPLPLNAGYEELASAICPAEWREPALKNAKARLEAYAAAHGAAALQFAVTGGQYSHADGVFYGGKAATWSREILYDIVARHAAQARRLAMIDFHTGLGPWGHGEKIATAAPHSPGLARSRQWFGDDVTSPALGNSASADVRGDMLAGVGERFRRLEFTGLALEFGTLPYLQVLDAVRADNWLHIHGKLDSTQGREIKAMVRDAFYGDRDDWKDMILEQAIAVQRMALRGLSG